MRKIIPFPKSNVTWIGIGMREKENPILKINVIGSSTGNT